MHREETRLAGAATLNCKVVNLTQHAASVGYIQDAASVCYSGLDSRCTLRG